MSDTSEITNGCLVHYDSSHIQTRRDFMGICKYNRDEFAERRKKEPNQECMAKIVRLVETLTNHEKAEWKLNAMQAQEKGLPKPKEPKRYPLDLSNGAFIHLMYETFGESTVRNSLNYLVEICYLGREQEKKNASPRIWLEQEYVQAILRAQAEVILAGYEFVPPSYQGAISYPAGVISNPSAVISRNGHSYAGCEITDNNIDNREENYKDTNKTEEREAFADPHDARAFSANENDSYRHDHTRKEDAWRCEAWRNAHDGASCEEYQAWIDSGGRDAPTDKQAAVKIGVTDGPHDAHLRPASDHRPGAAAAALGPGGLAGQVAIGVTDANTPLDHHPTTDHQRGVLRLDSDNSAQPSADAESSRDDTVAVQATHRATEPTRRPDRASHREQVAIASTPGEPDSPPSVLTRQSHTSSSLSDVDGAAAGEEASRPRASDEQTTSVSLTAASATSPPAQMAAGAVTQASILADWEAIQGQPQAWTDRHYKAARQGVRASPTREELAGCRAWLPTTDNPKTLWYHSHGVELWDVIEKLNAYRSHLALSIEPAPLADMPKPKPMDIYTANSLDKEKMKRRVAEMKANAAKKGLQVPHHGTN